MIWQTAKHRINVDRPLVMGILNVTPDSFSDGGRFVVADDALAQAEQMISDGVDIIDIGGESTRPGSECVDVETETARVLPVIEAIALRFDTPISIDTSKSEVARRAVDAGADIINDISGLRWDAGVADIAARTGSGLVLMHSRGDFDAMHTQPAVENIIDVVAVELRRSIGVATTAGVKAEQIVLDVGVGFGKSLAQNLELIAKLGRLVTEFETYPLLVGASRKSFIGKITGENEAGQRIGGSIAAAVMAVANGARIVRVHDVRETVNALRILSAIDAAG